EPAGGTVNRAAAGQCTEQQRRQRKTCEERHDAPIRMSVCCYSAGNTNREPDVIPALSMTIRPPLRVGRTVPGMATIESIAADQKVLCCQALSAPHLKCRTLVPR